MRPSSALIVHRRLKAAVAELARAEKNAVTLFAEVLRRKLYRDLGYGSIHLYAQAELSFSASKTSQFVRLAESLESLPKLKEEVKAGSLPWTKAREVAKVATADTEAAWIGVAKTSSRRKLEASIGEARAEATAAKRADSKQTVLPRQRTSAAPPPAPMPASVTLRFTPEQLAQFEALMEAVQKKGVRGSREAVLLAALEAAASGDASAHTAARSPYQVTVTLCPSCGTASLPTSRGTATLDAASRAAILSDCDSIDGTHRKRSAIPPRVRRRVLERDGHRCRAPGCTNTRFLEIDHIVPVEAGGTNDPSNLRVLCSACHRARHRRDALYPGKRSGLARASLVPAAPAGSALARASLVPAAPAGSALADARSLEDSRLTVGGHRYDARQGLGVHPATHELRRAAQKARSPCPTPRSEAAACEAPPASRESSSE